MPSVVTCDTVPAHAQAMPASADLAKFVQFLCPSQNGSRDTGTSKQALIADADMKFLLSVSSHRLPPAASRPSPQSRCILPRPAHSRFPCSADCCIAVEPGVSGQISARGKPISAS